MKYGLELQKHIDTAKFHSQFRRLTCLKIHMNPCSGQVELKFKTDMKNTKQNTHSQRESVFWRLNLPFGEDGVVLGARTVFPLQTGGSNGQIGCYHSGWPSRKWPLFTPFCSRRDIVVVGTKLTSEITWYRRAGRGPPSAWMIAFRLWSDFTLFSTWAGFLLSLFGPASFPFMAFRKEKTLADSSFFFFFLLLLVRVQHKFFGNFPLNLKVPSILRKLLRFL